MVRAQDGAEGIGGIPQLDLHAVEATLEQPPKPKLLGDLLTETLRRLAGGQLELAHGLGLFGDQVVIVVAGQKHQPPALKLLAQQVQ